MAVLVPAYSPLVVFNSANGNVAVPKHVKPKPSSASILTQASRSISTPPSRKSSSHSLRPADHAQGSPIVTPPPRRSIEPLRLSIDERPETLRQRSVDSRREKESRKEREHKEKEEQKEKDRKEKEEQKERERREKEEQKERERREKEELKERQHKEREEQKERERNEKQIRKDKKRHHSVDSQLNRRRPSIDSHHQPDKIPDPNKISMWMRLTRISNHLIRPQPFVMASRAAVTPHERYRRTIHTAGCIIIGDEVLGGKTNDTNSAYLAKFCFSLGIALKRIVVIGDDQAEIVEATRKFSDDYDFVVTSGGIGPTHDDITYESIAAAFKLPLAVHEDAFARMKRISRPHKEQPDFSWDKPSPALEAKKRMIILPNDSSRPLSEQAIFPCEDLWVPVSIVNGNVHILPGVPRLFEKLLDGMRPTLLPRLTDPEGKGIHRIYFSTPLPESEVAGFLTTLSKRTEQRDVKVGSYPRWGKKNNTVTLVGRDKEYMESLVSEVEAGVRGRRVNIEGEDDGDGSDKDA